MKFSHISRMAVVVVTIVSVLPLTCAVGAATIHKGVVEGVVKNASGQSVAGAFVKLKNAERRLTLMVISQAQGRYTADQLPPGKYTVQGIGAGFESPWSAPVDVANGRATKLDLSLTKRMGPMLPPAWPNRIAEDLAEKMTPPEGQGKQIVEARCKACHGLEDVIKMRVNRDTWKMFLDQMQEEVSERNLRPWSAEEANIMLEYLASNFPPMPEPDPNSRLPMTLMHGPTGKYRVVQYDLINGNAQTHDVASDPWGHGWANQRAGFISHLDPDTLVHEEIAPPLARPGATVRPGNLQVSKDGKVWFPEGRRMMSYDIKTKKWEIYDYPANLPGGPGGNSLVVAPDGMVWSSGPGMIKRLNPKTKEWKAYELPSKNQLPGGYGINVAGDGSIWMALDHSDHMARLDAETGKIQELKIPAEGRLYPRRLGPDAEGNVWVGLWRAGKLLKIDPRTNNMTTYDPPSGRLSGAYSVSVDKKNNLVWVSLHTVDKIARFNPGTGEWAEFPLPQAQSDVRRIEVDPSNPNRIWWSTAGGTTNGTTGSSISGGSRIGFLEVHN